MPGFLTKLKLYSAAVLTFLLTLLTAKYYRGKAKQKEREIKREKAKIHNLKAQVEAAKRAQERHKKEIEDALKDDSYLDYFDKS